MNRQDQTTLQAVGDVALQLTSEERQLIADFRAMERCAQQMIVDCAAQYRWTLPAERVRLALVS
jgi:hypothetical protein